MTPMRHMGGGKFLRDNNFENVEISWINNPTPCASWVSYNGFLEIFSINMALADKFNFDDFS